MSSSSLSPSDSRKRVAYMYDPDIGSFYYGPGHPMKPQRIRMAHSLILAYDLYKNMEVYRPHKSVEPELAMFHETEYIDFLSNICVDNYKEYNMQLRRFNVGEATDCPIFDGLFAFQQSCAGASIDGAMKLNNQQADICINWSGGLHHAKRAEASGFCYINDIVLGILELLKYHARVIYIDIDVHHGDGVEEAFYVTHRVMTVSFHKFGDFFPGTGDLTDVGISNGKYYSVNVPLNDGIDDESFLSIFKPIITKCIEIYKPGVIVLQCGADSLTGDRLGKFNLSVKGHAQCIKFCKSFNIPLLILGGGGYTIKNVARCWAYETGVILNKESDMNDQIPINDYYDYYSPDFNLHLQPNSNLHNLNTPEHLEKLKNKCLENLSLLKNSPSIQFAYVPPDLFDTDLSDDDTDFLKSKVVNDEGGGKALGSGCDYSCSDYDEQHFDVVSSNHNNSYSPKKKKKILNLQQQQKLHQRHQKFLQQTSRAGNINDLIGTSFKLRRKDYDNDYFDAPDQDQIVPNV